MEHFLPGFVFVDKGQAVLAFIDYRATSNIFTSSLASPLKQVLNQNLTGSVPDLRLFWQKSSLRQSCKQCISGKGQPI